MIFNILGLFNICALLKIVTPCFVFALKEAPAFTSENTISVWLSATPAYKGVAPFGWAISKSAPAAIKKLTTSIWPFCEAIYKEETLVSGWI